MFKIQYEGWLVDLHMTHPTDDDVETLRCVYIITPEMSWMPEEEDKGDIDAWFDASNEEYLADD
jgi:hypothetical protein